jgi:pimeloyl-ACP methyl ester carboxylesterase
MDRRSFAAAITLGSAAALFGAQQASAAPPTDAMPRARNVVLVHGAYADGSCWSDVIPYLQARGLNVASVQNPLRTLDEDCEFARRTLALMDGPTVLAAHSYSGMIATEVGVDPKVTALVYIAARAHPTPARTTPRSPRSTRRPRRVQVW